MKKNKLVCPLCDGKDLVFQVNHYTNVDIDAEFSINPKTQSIRTDFYNACVNEPIKASDVDVFCYSRHSVDNKRCSYNNDLEGFINNLIEINGMKKKEAKKIMDSIVSSINSQIEQGGQR